MQNKPLGFELAAVSEGRPVRGDEMQSEVQTRMCVIAAGLSLVLELNTPSNF